MAKWRVYSKRADFEEIGERILRKILPASNAFVATNTQNYEIPK